MAKVSDVDGLAPRAMDSADDDKESGEGVHMKKELSLTNGVAIIVGVIVGSGIFVSPNQALLYAGSKGLALVIWVLCGILSMLGALCYAELGTMIPKSGGDYAYIGEVFGPLPAFLYLWVSLIIMVPTGNAITALTFANNIIQPIWIDCKPNDSAVTLVAAVITCLLTVINCYNVKWVTRLQDSFTAAKVFALLIIFLASIWHLFNGHTENLKYFWQGTKMDGIAAAFYAGFFSYSGWNYLNFVTEELKDPYRNLPRAICISLPIVTIVYALTNMAFFVVLSNDAIIVTEAVAVTFGVKMLHSMAWIMPLFVALCTIGSLNGAIYASSRLFFVGARNGHLPLAISLINVKTLTPVPSITFMCLMTLILMIPNNIKFLVIMVSAAEAVFTMMSVTGMLWLRRTHPEMQRPIRVNLIVPITYLITCTFLIVFTCYTHPYEVGTAVASIALGVPVYCIFIKWQNKPKWLRTACDKFNIACSKLFVCLPENSKEL